MIENINRISQAELEVMKILWLADSPISSGDIFKELSEQMGWDRSTVRTLLKRLEDKGVVATTKAKVLSYLPLINEKEYCDVQMKSFVERIYGGNAKRMVSSLVENYDLTPSDIEEIRQILGSGGINNE